MNNINLDYSNYVNYGVDLNEENLSDCLRFCRHKVRTLEKLMLEFASDGRFGAARKVARDLEVEKLMLEELKEEVTQI
jgi:hypothetical protein